MIQEKRFPSGHTVEVELPDLPIDPLASVKFEWSKVPPPDWPHMDEYRTWRDAIMDDWAEKAGMERTAFGPDVFGFRPKTT